MKYYNKHRIFMTYYRIKNRYSVIFFSYTGILTLWKRDLRKLLLNTDIELSAQ